MILDSFKLDGKVVLITGAGRGLGRAMAVRFANCGADIVAAARTVAQLEETAALVRQIGRKCIIVPTDVGKSEECNAMVAAAIKEFGRVDVMINNAGIGEDSFGKPIEKITDEEWHRGIDVNLSSQFYWRAPSSRTWSRPSAARLSTSPRAMAFVAVNITICMLARRAPCCSSRARWR